MRAPGTHTTNGANAPGPARHATLGPLPQTPPQGAVLKIVRTALWKLTARFRRGAISISEWYAGFGCGELPTGAGGFVAAGPAGGRRIVSGALSWLNAGMRRRIAPAIDMSHHHVCPCGLATFWPIRSGASCRTPRNSRPHVTSGMRVWMVGSRWGSSACLLARLVGPKGRVFCVDLQQKMLDSLVRRARRAQVSTGSRCGDAGRTRSAYRTFTARSTSPWCSPWFMRLTILLDSSRRFTMPCDRVAASCLQTQGTCAVACV